MPLVSQSDMHAVVLEIMQDGEPRNRQSVIDDVKERLDLSIDERRYKTKSGKPIYVSRASWSITYLERAGFIERLSRGIYQVTNRGRQYFNTVDSSEELYREMVRIIENENPWKKGSRSEAADNMFEESASKEGEQSPHELIESLVDDFNSAVRGDLMARIMSSSPQFFEKLVVDLLVLMGYGDGTTTPPSNDGGIDGLIAADPFGFNQVYIQAKRYDRGNRIGRPLLNGFVGAMRGRGATNGVFITTSTFTDDAEVYAKTCPGVTLVLVDGEMLVDLMMEYGLAVEDEATYCLKRVNADYFEE